MTGLSGTHIGRWVSGGGPFVNGGTPFGTDGPPLLASALSPEAAIIILGPPPQDASLLRLVPRREVVVPVRLQLLPELAVFSATMVFCSLTVPLELKIPPPAAPALLSLTVLLMSSTVPLPALAPVAPLKMPPPCQLPVTVLPLTVLLMSTSLPLLSLKM